MSSDVTNVIELYDHPLQDGNMFIAATEIAGNGYLIVYSNKDNEMKE